MSSVVGGCCSFYCTRGTIGHDISHFLAQVQRTVQFGAFGLNNLLDNQYFPLPVIFVMCTACRFPVNYLTLKREHTSYGNRFACIFQVAVKH